MEAGKLNRQVTFQRKTTAELPSGEEVTSWVDAGTCWAALENITAADAARQYGQAVQAELRFKVRYRTDLTTLMALTYSGQRYEVIKLEESQDRTFTLVFVRCVNGTI